MLSIVACSSSAGTSQVMPGAGGSSAAAGAVSLNLAGSSFDSGGGAQVMGGGSLACSITDDSGCVGQAYEGESVPLDIYIMFDESGSMCSCVDPPGGQLCPDPNCAQTRLDAVRAATSAFLSDPESAGIGVGIGYFGKQPIGQTSCDPLQYSAAAVPIATLPAQASAIVDSLSAIQPTGETPSGAAIRGACGYAQQQKSAHPDHQVVLLLLTDGKPEAPVTCMNGAGACCPTLDDAVAAASDCLSSSAKVKTYVLGVGPLLANLDQIATAGGTQHAYLVEAGDVSAQVLQALGSIRGDAIPCEFELPPPPSGQALALDRVNITYASSTCQPSYYSHVETQAACSTDGGWYYDDPSAPQQAVLCPASCEQVKAPGGRLLFTVGCATRESVR